MRDFVDVFYNKYKIKEVEHIVLIRVQVTYKFIFQLLQHGCSYDGMSLPV